MSKNILIAVVGPTAIGKTSLSIALAKHFDTEILSADSRQFFKELQIGTAVPSKAELAAVPHHFIHHKSIHQSYSVGDFEREAISCLDTLFQKHNIVLLVGGSGLYVDSVVKGLDDFPEVDQEIRKGLQHKLEAGGIEVLQEELKQLDPVHYSNVDLENPRRLIRALEISIATKKPYSAYLEARKADRAFKTIYLGIQAPREVIYQRINSRVDAMISNGLVDEAKSLLAHKDLNALQTVGYKELFTYFEGKSTLEFSVSEIKKNTRRFAKRQLTWYRKSNQILWVDYDAPFDRVLEQLKIELNALKNAKK